MGINVAVVRFPARHAIQTVAVLHVIVIATWRMVCAYVSLVIEMPLGFVWIDVQLAYQVQCVLKEKIQSFTNLLLQQMSSRKYRWMCH